MSETKDDYGVKCLLREMEQELRAMRLTNSQIMQKMAEFTKDFATHRPYGRYMQLRIIEGGRQSSLNATPRLL